MPDVDDHDQVDSFGDDSSARIVTACDRFEAEWRDDRSPRIEDYLDRAGPTLRDRLFPELLGIELEIKRERGEVIRPDEYLQRFPERAAAVADAFLPHLPGSDGPEAGMETHPSDADEPPISTLELDSGAFSPDRETVSADDGVTDRSRPKPGDQMPDRFGRYLVTKLLGKGGSGSVYLAFDEVLKRLVAVKVLHRALFRSQRQVELFLAEASIAAGLRHPSIVQVYDVGGYLEDEVYVVFEYVEGRTLAAVFKAGRFPPAWVANLMVQVAEVVHHAHRAGLVHRDLKPPNILIDGQGRPHIADFGLAIREDLQHLRAGEIAGTPTYMAPEQVRGETHRLDVRTDIWAMGVILYLGLVRRLPFAGRNRPEIFRAVLDDEPKPPREVDPGIPPELERICLKCLSKRMDDRYETAAELTDDLRTWLGGRDTGRGTPRIVPKGLRAFDIEDAEFFLSLVPGPRDRDGLPESIRAWKRRIEEPDPARSFAVGLLYGPSGGGKSSFVKAGLLPKLKAHIRRVYVEAAAVGTEARLLDGLRRAYPGLPAGCGLAEAAAAVREVSTAAGGMKILVVLDQFEQWLQVHPAEIDGELVRALRHCDGTGLQALLLVRDDFWMATTRFLKALEVRPVEGTNSAAVEQFDPRHARHVLAEIGRALGRLPDATEPEEARFLEDAVKELASPDGRVIPVRLTLLAETLRHREWSSATLRELGGFRGIGELFLEQTFSAPTAPPAHREHQRAAQAVLAALLPDASSNLKGRLRPSPGLREAAGYADRPDDFAALIDILDNELRMVTPVDPSAVKIADGAAPAPIPGSPGESYYQLTHDYLVPPIRQWLTRKQTETRRGRAELQLASLTAYWRDRPVRRRLPSLIEWLRILAFTGHRTWSPDERRMMRAATRSHLMRGAAAVAIGLALGYGAATIRDRDRAQNLLDRTLEGEYRNVRANLPELVQYRDMYRPQLEALEAGALAERRSPRLDALEPEAMAEAMAVARRRLIAVALLYHDRPTSGRAAFLRGRLAEAQPDEVTVICDAMGADRELAGLIELRRIVLDDSTEPGVRLRAACALAALTPDFSASDAAAPLSEALLSEPRELHPRWLRMLGPSTRRSLVRSLGEICCDPDRPPMTQAAAAEVLAEVHKGGNAVDVLTFLRGVLDERVEDPRDESRKDDLAARQAVAAITLASLGDPDSLWPRLKHSGDPRLRSLLIWRLGANGLPTHILLDRLTSPTILPIERQALLLALADAHHSAVASPTAAAVITVAHDLYLGDPDPAVHSAAELLLRRWRGDEYVAAYDRELKNSTIDKGRRRWERGPNEHTFAILPAPLEFRMGSPEHEEGRDPEEVPHYRRIARSLAVSTKEVTVAQLHRLLPDLPKPATAGERPDCAANLVSWYEALRYCNRLSEEAGLAPSQWCYPEHPGPGMVISEDAVDKPGFRLPTEAEWEYICRAGTETAWPFGQSPALLPRYAWTWLNPQDRAQPPGRLLPNDLGIFDAVGNVWEWCQEGSEISSSLPDIPKPAYPTGTKEHPAGDPSRREVLAKDVVGIDSWRIVRGGAFDVAPKRSRSANRDWIGPLDRRENIGFRVVRTIPPEKAR
ncbi:MAG: protein kinase domain-containing protein [Isosphaeraceae bacterium]